MVKQKLEEIKRDRNGDLISLSEEPLDEQRRGPCIMYSFDYRNNSDKNKKLRRRLLRDLGQHDCNAFLREAKIDTFHHANKNYTTVIQFYKVKRK